MNNEANQAIQTNSKTFPFFYPLADSPTKLFHISRSELELIEFNKSNRSEPKICNSQGLEWEMEPVEIEKYEADNDIKLTFNHLGSLRKFNLFIDISKLEIKTTRAESGKRNLLCNSKFIASYMLLTQREKQVLKQLSLMKTSEEIASILFISPNTVKNHRKSIKQKIDFTSREEQSRFLYWVRGFVS